MTRYATHLPCCITTKQLAAQFFGVLFVLCVISPQAHPSPRYIELADGSVIKGEVVSAANGTYRVKTAAMGVLELKEADIRSIASSAPTGGPPAADVAGTAEASDIQRRILSDPELLKSIHALQGDPAVESILRDPEVMRAIQSRDVRALQNNDKIERLIESPAVRDVLNALTK
ncbi:MAG: hypothetical protein HY749_20085 [Gammaproteobacteria bacterium]|nr:hypothetical protein [Gammaproteobacteria bacterium]